MTTTDLRVEATRNELPESVHRVACAVVAAGDGRLLACSGDPEGVTWWRSAAKPFQALPLVEDGAARRFELDDRELAVICASHSSEPIHLEVVEALLAKGDLPESALACGPHTPLSPAIAALAARGVVHPTAAWSNCSGKHAGMLLLARHHDWPLAGYERDGHPVQQRILEVVTHWTGLPASGIGLGVDGCTAVCFALPLRHMALAYARLGASGDEAPRRVLGAMTAHPRMVAGSGRLCTDLMTAWRGRIVAKVGAEGIYCAAIPEIGIGIALKVEDGDMPSAPPALLEVIQQCLERLSPSTLAELPLDALAAHRVQPIRNTRGKQTGERRAVGVLRFPDAESGELVRPPERSA